MINNIHNAKWTPRKHKALKDAKTVDNALRRILREAYLEGFADGYEAGNRKFMTTEPALSFLRKFLPKDWQGVKGEIYHVFVDMENFVVINHADVGHDDPMLSFAVDRLAYDKIMVDTNQK